MIWLYLFGSAISLCFTAVMAIREVRKGWLTITVGDFLMHLTLVASSWCGVIILIMTLSDCKWLRKDFITFRRRR